MDSCNEGEAQCDWENQTWELVNMPKDENAIGVRWVYRTKFNPVSSV